MVEARVYPRYKHLCHDASIAVGVFGLDRDKLSVEELVEAISRFLAVGLIVLWGVDAVEPDYLPITCGDCVAVADGCYGRCRATADEIPGGSGDSDEDEDEEEASLTQSTERDTPCKLIVR
jgi:hypothetical protein